jgi:predicted transcriptional regulator
MLVTRMLQGEPVRRFMNDQPVTVPSQTTLEDFVENYLYQYHHKMYPITDGEALQGCLHVRQIHQVPREEWSKTPVVDVAGSCDRDSAISPQTDALDALSRMRQQESGRLLVLEDGKLAGILTLRDLLEFLALKTEMEEGVPAEAVENAAGVAG